MRVKTSGRSGAVIFQNTTVNVPHTDTMDQVKDPKTGKDVDTGYLSPDRVAGFFKILTRTNARLLTVRPEHVQPLPILS